MNVTTLRNAQNYAVTNSRHIYEYVSSIYSVQYDAHKTIIGVNRKLQFEMAAAQNRHYEIPLAILYDIPIVLSLSMIRISLPNTQNKKKSIYNYTLLV